MALEERVVVLVTDTVPAAALRDEHEGAVKLIVLAATMRPDGGLLRAADLAVHRLFVGCDAAERAHFVTSTLGSLRASPHGDESLATLQALIGHDGRVAAAAADLHIHPKTVHYRMKRIARLTGLRFDRSDDRLRLALAIHLSAFVPSDRANP